MKKSVLGVVVTLTVAMSSTAEAEDAAAARPLGYMIANYQINDQADYQQYLDAAGSLVAQYGGRVIVFNLNAAAVEGSPKSVIAIAEFPAVEDAERCYNSPEYSAAKPFRIASTEGAVIITAGLPQQ